MTRLKIFFLTLSLMMFIPMWRWLDFIQWIWVSSSLYAVAFFFTGLLLICLPLLIFKFKKAFLISLSCLLIYTGIILTQPPLSKENSAKSDNTHCGHTTYSGIFYAINSWMPPSHSDDLEIRNQLCWIRKLIGETPNKLSTSSDLELYLNKAQTILLSPNVKFKTSLPLIAFYQIVIFSKYPDFSKNTAETNSKIFLESLKFWQDQYTYEVNSKNYPWWDFPHGPYVNWEYGIVEKNWEKIVDFLRNNKSD